MGSVYDAVIVGAGPNGLAAGIALAQAGHKVLVLEAQPTVGGGARSAVLTEPGFIHDVCSSVYALSVGSPFFRTLPLDKYGLRWAHPPLPLAHPLDEGRAVLLERSLTQTAAGLGPDGPSYQRLMEPLAAHWEELASDILAPLRLPTLRHLGKLLPTGLRAVRSAVGLADGLFRTTEARALFAGLAGHAILPLEKAATAAFGMVLGATGHAVGWPFAQGGGQTVSDALAAHLLSLGGQIVTEHPVTDVEALPSTRAVILDLTPRQVVNLLGGRLPDRYRRALSTYRYGPGVFKLDYALDGPIPWRADPCGRAGTVHLGGTLEEIAEAERQVWHGEHPSRPFVLLTQPSVADPSRAPVRCHAVWAYCHVPHGSTLDMTGPIEEQIERFAPGFKSRIIKRHTMGTVELERYNANYVGGDINGGAQDLAQLLARPVARWTPYSTPLAGVFLCSASTPPGGGVHGMCGFGAAQTALRYLGKRPEALPWLR